jgi:hypothetical protein
MMAPTGAGEAPRSLPMLLLRLLVFSFVVLFLAVLITQIVLPAIKGTRLFPMFDLRRRRAYAELSRARAARELEDVRKAVDDEHRAILEDEHE